MEKKEKQLMSLTTSSHFLVHLFEGILPPLIPILMIVFNTDYFHLGLIVSIFSYAFGLCSLPAGLLADRIYPKHIITLFLLGASISSAMVFKVNSIFMYGIIMGVIGIFAGLYHPASNTLIAHEIKEKGKGFGIHGIAGSIGVSSAPVLSAFIATSFGWKAPYIIYGAIGIGIAVFSLTIKQSIAASSANVGIKRIFNKEKISYHHIIVFFLSVAFLGLTYKGIMTFLPTYMGENVYFSFIKIDKVTLGGIVTTLTLLFGAVGQYITGRLTDKYKPEKIYFFCIIFGAFFVFMIALTSNFLLILSSICYAFFYFSVQPIQNYIISAYLPSSRHGFGYGILFLLTFGVGSTAAVLSGYIADKFGLIFIFYTMGIFYVIAALASAVLYYMKSDKQKKSMQDSFRLQR